MTRNILHFKLFERYADLWYGLSQKTDGSMKLFDDPSADRITSQNRQTYFQHEGLPLDQIVSAAVVHGTKVETVNEQDGGKVFSETDGLVTREPNVFLSVTVADCFPVYFFDPQSRAVGIAHAGWKGILAGVIPQTVSKLVNAGAKQENLLAVIGPGILKHHFEIKDDIVSRFSSYTDTLDRLDNKIFADLPEIIRKQLIGAGIQEKNIEASDICTYCSKDDYFSYRRDKPNIVEAMVVYIGIK